MVSGGLLRGCWGWTKPSRTSLDVYHFRGRRSWPLRFAVILMHSCPVRPVCFQSRAFHKCPVTVVQQEWHREGKEMLANVTLHNQNGFSVKNAIVTCEIYEETRVPQNRRGVTVRRVLPPGRTTVSDLAFPIAANDAQGDSCQVLSAQKV